MFTACGGEEDPFHPGQTGEVWGTAFDASTGGILSGVTVAVGGKSAQSGSNGQYVLKGVPTGEQSLTASKEGYLGHSTAVTVVAADTTFINVSLAPARGPAGLTAETGSESGQIHLRWGIRDQVESYTLYWSTEPGVTAASGTRIAEIKETTYDHNGLSPGTAYYYVLAAVTNGAEGPISAKVSATAGNGIALKVQDPGGGFVADTNFQATVLVSSVFQLVSVTATVEDRVTPLSFLTFPDRWHARVSLAGFPSPRARTVTFTATDINGTVATASQSFEHNRRAIITVEAPKPQAVALPEIRLRATCEDDVAAGCAAFEAKFGLNQQIAGGAGGIDQEVSLAMVHGQTVSVNFQATDDLGRFTIEVVEVHVDASPRLTSASEVSGLGTVIDASSDRLLVLDSISGRDARLETLKIQNRATGQSSDLLDRELSAISETQLTARGAVFQAREEATNFTLAHEWRDNMLLNLGRASADIVVDGPYFIWGTVNGALHRKNHESGATVDVPDAAPNGFADVGPNGDVVYRSPAGEIQRFRDGVVNAIAQPDPDPAIGIALPQTDGINIVYVKGEFAQSVRSEFSLLAFAASGTEILVPLQEGYRPGPGISYRLNGGWIAYTKPAIGGAVQVWVRDPTGAQTQISFFSGESVIEELAADGRVVFSNPAGQPVRRRYLWVPGGTAAEIGSGLGRPKFIDGQLHVMLGNALLLVN